MRTASAICAIVFFLSVSRGTLADPSDTEQATTPAEESPDLSDLKPDYTDILKDDTIYVPTQLPYGPQKEPFMEQWSVDSAPLAAPAPRDPPIIKCCHDGRCEDCGNGYDKEPENTMEDGVQEAHF